MKIPPPVVVVAWFTQQTVKDDEDGGDGGMREGEIFARLLDGSHGKTWQKWEDVCGWRKDEKSGCFLNRDRDRDGLWWPNCGQSCASDILVAPFCPLCHCFMQSALIPFGLEQIFLFGLTFRLTGGLSHSVCGGFGGVFEDRTLDHLIHCACHYLRGGVCVCGSWVIDSRVVGFHNL